MNCIVNLYNTLTRKPPKKLFKSDSQRMPFLLYVAWWYTEAFVLRCSHLNSALYQFNFECI